MFCIVGDESDKQENNADLLSQFCIVSVTYANETTRLDNRFISFPSTNFVLQNLAVQN